MPRPSFGAVHEHEEAATAGGLEPEPHTKAALELTVTNVFVCRPGPDLGRDLPTG
jgi:hypothetical protein